MLKRTIVLIMAGIVLSTIFFYYYNKYISAQWLAHPSSGGTFITVDGHKIFCRVQGQGSPAVIIEPWGGGPSFEWWNIQDSLARRTTVITYDRGGYGWSDPGTLPRTGDRIVEEILQIMLQRNITGPVVLVGHSIGGLYAVHFARQYPNRVCGVVLLDAVSLNNQRWWNEFRDYARYFDKARFARMARKFSQLGLTRLFKPAPYPNIPDNVRGLVFEHYCQLKAFDAMIDEVSRMDQSIEMVKNLPAFPDIPLKILFPSPESNVKLWVQYGMREELAQKMEALHQELAREQLAYSPKSEWVVVEKSGHGMHLDRPDVVIKEIFDMVDKTKK